MMQLVWFQRLVSLLNANGINTTQFHETTTKRIAEEGHSNERLAASSSEIHMELIVLIHVGYISMIRWGLLLDC